MSLKKFHIQRSKTLYVIFTATSCSVLLHVTHTYPGCRPDVNRLDHSHLQGKFLGECIRWEVSVPQWSLTWDGRPWHHASLSFSLEVPLVRPMPLSWHRWQKSNLDDDKIHKLSHQMCLSCSLYFLNSVFWNLAASKLELAISGLVMNKRDL